MHQPHQSEPLKWISTALPSFLAMAWAVGKSESQGAGGGAPHTLEANPKTISNEN
ncbi:MAG TPA: hypothetical protein VNH84_18325 [Candidatus Saccharimonadales bacterium]|nr:hypothetical protein [Candidatus Saccharimonadales bacterium]